jgi:PAS domain S-box-containing protein
MIGYPREQFKTYLDFVALIHPDDTEKAMTAMRDYIEKKTDKYEVEYRLKTIEGSYKWFRDIGSLIEEPIGSELKRVIGIVEDITERMLVRNMLEIRLSLVDFSNKHSLNEFLEKTLDELCKITESMVAFYHFLEPDQKTISLQTWSTATLQKLYESEGKSFQYNVEQTDVWVDCINSRKPVFHNNLAAFKNKKGTTEGHTRIIRELVIPIIQEEKIIAVMGICNKLDHYNEKDIEIVSYFAGLAMEITEYKKVQEEILNLNIELEQRVLQRTSQLEITNKELEAFSFSVSHDLRAPLRAINGFVQILMEDYIQNLDEEGKRICSVIQDNSFKMGKLIDNLLSFSRLGRTEMNNMHINMKQMADAVFFELTDAPLRKRIHFTCDEICIAFGDPILLNQVWSNLISNAIKYSSKKEKAIISVSCTIEKEQNIFCIRDNGVGFDMNYADKLFNVFRRLHSEGEFEGTGVGLAIVKRIVQRHGGEVWAESELNKGASFYFSLPVVKTDI